MGYQGVAIPIYWEDLQKKGNSSVEERKQMISKAIKYYNVKDKILLTDREYIGEEWFCFLKDNSIGFVIRLRKKNYKETVNETEGGHTAQWKERLLEAVNRERHLARQTFARTTLQLCGTEKP